MDYLTFDRNRLGAWILRHGDDELRVYFASKKEAERNFRKVFNLKGKHLVKLDLYE